jgi:hypothetical protein
MTRKDDERRDVHTDGGAYVGGNVETGGGEFVGRDKIVQAGERGVAVGGDLHGTVVTGDGNVVGQHQGALLAEFQRLLAELRQGLAQAGLDDDAEAIIDGEFRVVEEQAAKPQPVGPIITAKLESATKMLTALAGTAAAAQRLLPMAQQAVEWAGQLFR